MKAWRLVVLAVILLWIAGALQQGLAPRLSVFSARPDFLIISISALSLLGQRWAGGVFGFAGGVVQGAMAGANLAAYAISRTIGGFALGWVASMDLDHNLIAVFLATVGATWISQLLLMFGAPPASIGSFLLATIGSAVYNGVIVMPVFALLRRVADPPAI